MPPTTGPLRTRTAHISPPVAYGPHNSPWPPLASVLPWARAQRSRISHAAAATRIGCGSRQAQSAPCAPAGFHKKRAAHLIVSTSIVMGRPVFSKVKHGHVTCSSLASPRWFRFRPCHQNGLGPSHRPFLRKMEAGCDQDHSQIQ